MHIWSPVRCRNRGNKFTRNGRERWFIRDRRLDGKQPTRENVSRDYDFITHRRGHRLPVNLPWTENRPRDHAEKSYRLVLARWMSSAYRRISDVVIKFRSRGWMMEDRNQPWSIVDRLNLSMIMRRNLFCSLDLREINCVLLFKVR